MRKIIHGTEEVKDLGVFVERIVSAAALPRHARASADYVDVKGSVVCVDRNATGTAYIFTASFDEKIRGQDRQTVRYCHDYTHSHDDGRHDPKAYAEEQMHYIADRVKQRSHVLGVIVEGSKLRVESIMHALSAPKPQNSKG